jgi:hypothetical protein
MAYQTTYADLSIKIYALVQSVLTIYNFDRTFSIPVAFLSRDPTYAVFDVFDVAAGVDNFNILNVSATDNVFLVRAGATIVSTIAVPPGAQNILQVQSALLGLLPGWAILFDATQNRFYFRPPVSVATLAATVAGVPGTYETYEVLSFDFSACAPSDPYSIAALLGLAPAVAAGSVILSEASTYSSSGTVVLDPALTTIAILDVHNSQVASITLLKTQYNTVLDLVDQVHTSLLQQGVPLQIAYNVGTGRVVLTPYDITKTYKLVFQQGTPAAGLSSIAQALGFDPGFAHANVAIQSLAAVTNYMTQGWYTHPFLDVVNSVPFSMSIKVRGIGIVTNGSTIVSGSLDCFYCTTASGGTRLAYDAAQPNLLTGGVSLAQYTQAAGPPSTGITALQGYTYFAPTNAYLSTLAGPYLLSNYLAAQKGVELYAVTLVSNRYVFTRPDGTVPSAGLLRLSRGATTVFDLRGLPGSSRLKLSLVSNGPNAGGSEFSGFASTDGETMPRAYRRFLLGGQFMQLQVPVTDGSTHVLYYYDDLEPSVVTTATSLTWVYYFTVDSSGYLLVSNKAALTDALSTLTFSRTPILDLRCGNTYLFDYSAVLLQLGYSTEQLSLSLTVDGLH